MTDDFPFTYADMRDGLSGFLENGGKVCKQESPTKEENAKITGT